MICEKKLPERAAELGEKLRSRLQSFVDGQPDLCSEVRGRGLLIGLVLRDAEKAASLPGRALERGILVNVTAGDVMRPFPPLNIPEDELWPAVDTLLELVRNAG